MYSRTALKDNVYLEMVQTISKLSKDKQTQNGAIIVAKDGTPVSWGYNGTVSGFRDEIIPHSREKKRLNFEENCELKTFEENKYPFMCHAEENALDFGDNEKLKGATIYVTGMPCGHCARQIAKKKIARVVIPAGLTYDKNSTMEKDEMLTKFIFAEAGIQLFIGEEVVCLTKW